MINSLKNKRLIQLRSSVLFLIVCLIMNCGNIVIADDDKTKDISVNKNQVMNKINKTEDDWKKELTPEQFAVTRQQCTERPFTGKYTHWNEKGEFTCVCCGAILFDSDHKFDSGTGWPSFFEAAKTGNIETRPDHSMGMERIEVLCRHCGAHLGHLFPDGPKPTGLRYCINSAALKFEEKK